MQRLEKSELRKADCTVGVNCNMKYESVKYVIEVASNQHIQFPFLFLFEFLSET